MDSFTKNIENSATTLNLSSWLWKCW